MRVEQAAEDACGESRCLWPSVRLGSPNRVGRELWTGGPPLLLPWWRASRGRCLPLTTLSRHELNTCKEKGLGAVPSP